jgi:hypothetical protein
MPALSPRENGPEGLVGGYQGDSTAIKVIMGVLMGIVLYNAAELSLLIFMTFRHYRGLYFWSLVSSTILGLMPSGVGNIIHFFSIGPLWFALAISNFGFYFMVPAQSVVLYSRLHLVLYNQRILRLVLCATVFSTVFIAVPTTITTFGSAFVQTRPWNRSYIIVERLQVTWFCVQEFLISSLYIHETVKLLQLNPEQTSRRRTIMYQLIAINLFIILMDVVIVSIEFIGLYYLQVLLKSTIYSIKLKLEFAVLGKLTAIVDSSHSDYNSNGSAYQPGLTDIAQQSVGTWIEPMSTNRLSCYRTKSSKGSPI